MTDVERNNGLKNLKAAIYNKIFHHSKDLKFLDKLRQPGRMSHLVSLLGSSFKKSDQDGLRRLLADFFAAEIVQIADNDNEDLDGSTARDNAARAKLRIDTRRWLMEQFAPHLYGSGKTVRDESAAPVFRTQIYLPENGRP